jgi:quercetin dioxygenase-like cupin family protein
MTDHPKQTHESMKKRVVRFDELKQNPVTLMFTDSILPQHWRMNYAVIGDTASENPDYAPAITDPHKFQIGMGWAPPGCGPAWHTHDYVEMFFIIKGSWKFSWSNEENPDEPEGEFILNEWDSISLPAGVWRTFENASKDEISWFFAVLDPHEVFEGKDPYWPPNVMSKTEAAGFGSDESGRMIKPDNYQELQSKQIEKLLKIYKDLEGHDL